MPRRSRGRHWPKWRVRSRCREPCPTPTGRPKSSGIRARWFDRALASIDRHHAAGDGSGRPHARLIADDNAGSYDRHIETLTGRAHQTLLNLGAGRGAVPVSISRVDPLGSWSLVTEGGG